MARPQVFISSTFYDLKSIREDIARSMEELGYETIVNEVDSIPTALGDEQEISCHPEIDSCDILICIIGSRFGTACILSAESITKNALRSAYERGKQVYIFVDSSIITEKISYNKNKGIEEFSSSYANENKIFEFIDDVDELSIESPLFSFDTSSDIVEILKEQLAALFKTLLSENSHKSQVPLFDQLKSPTTASK